MLFKKHKLAINCSYSALHGDINVIDIKMSRCSLLSNKLLTLLRKKEYYLGCEPTIAVLRDVAPYKVEVFYTSDLWGLHPLIQQWWK